MPRSDAMALDGLIADGVPSPERPAALVVGYGAIGRSVASTLRETHDVTVFDTLPSRRLEVETAGLRWAADKSAGLTGAHLVVGCTGSTSIRLEDCEALPDHAVLVSCSSSDIEFEGWRLRAEAEPNAAQRRSDAFNLLREGVGNATRRCCWATRITRAIASTWSPSAPSASSSSMARSRSTSRPSPTRFHQSGSN